MLVYIIGLFFIMIPKQLITMPSSESSPLSINLTHSIVFASIYWLTHKMVRNMSNAYLNSNSLVDNSQNSPQSSYNNSIY